MFSRLIWDVAKVAKGIRILLLTAVSLLPHSSSASPVAADGHQHLRYALRLELRDRTVITDRPVTAPVA